MTDTEKLQLILEHAEEYYENSRKYEFVEGGFVSYEIFKVSEGVGLYIADIYVKPELRGGNTFQKLLEFCLAMENTHLVDVAYARTEKNNKYFNNLERMYHRIGFKEYSEDSEAVYYRLDV